METHGDEDGRFRRAEKLLGRVRSFRLPFDSTAPISEELMDGEEGARTITVIIKHRISSGATVKPW